MSAEFKTVRINMFMSPSEDKAIEDWAWKNRIRSKSEAIRRLIQLGLEAAEDQSHPDSVGAGVRFYRPYPTAEGTKI
jgi:metal-responsive CopG/Arc/MetJ family transcriptional regulator